ncbi:MAG: hypothetical protein E7241_03825 [Lachnospiraceae bacterium]|jgi:uncharacterized glyoxalase superfamily protein PhnB|nr:hypothetical protein [Lachnospiraceae bacterium]
MIKSRKRVISFVAALAFAGILVLSGCAGSGGSGSTAASTTASSAGSSVAASKINLADGTYDAKFTTDGKMFHVNDANKGMGILTVKDGKATIHVSLVSKTIVNLFLGTAEDAKKEGAKLLQPTTDTVKYEDGTTEEVYGFDIPVPVIDEEFDCALIGEKGKWYDHKVKVSEVKEKK